MPLTSGAKLGPYEIQSPLGAGGMGEVYRAKDTRLDRTVAIKVLPSHLSDDPELKQRMEREAKAISALQHANICTLYDIGTQDGTNFLVMEYLEGQTLADRLAKGALPLDQALKIGTEIAQALEKAHQHGIIHRDLKPANIMLTKAGAKLMDFGLAKPELSIAPQAIGPFTPSTPTSRLFLRERANGEYRPMAALILRGLETARNCSTTILPTTSSFAPSSRTERRSKSERPSAFSTPLRPDSAIRLTSPPMASVCS